METAALWLLWEMVTPLMEIIPTAVWLLIRRNLEVKLQLTGSNFSPVMPQVATAVTALAAVAAA